MGISIRLDALDNPGADHAVIEQLWWASLAERTGPEEFRALSLPRVVDFPTARSLLAQEEGTYIASGVAVLPGPGARFSFEKRVGFPHPALPTAERSRLGEGLGLYVKPEWRRGGLAHVLTFLPILLAWEAGAEFFAAENGAVSLSMAMAAGFTNTGVITLHRKDVPYYLTVGRTEEVLSHAWPATRKALEAFTLAPEVRAVIDRWSQFHLKVA